MKPSPRHSQLTGVSGVHFVAARLSHLKFHAVPTTRNVAGPDLLVSTIDGSSSLAVQVKTTNWAIRDRGRGNNKEPHHYEWDIGWASARENHVKLLFALVDLKDFYEMPDVYLMPSGVIHAYFKGGDPDTWKRARYHPLIAEVEQYRNNWEVVSHALKR